MDEIERAAIRAEGLDPDDPQVVAALDRVRQVLKELGHNNSGLADELDRCRVPNHRQSSGSIGSSQEPKPMPYRCR